MFLFVSANSGFIPYVFFSGLTAFYLILTYVIGFLGVDFNYEKHKKLCAKWLDKAASQDMDIFLPVCKEQKEILLNTWGFVSQLVKAHEGKLSVHILDDGKEEWIKDAAKYFKFNYITRPSGELKKAGNLRNAFKQTSGEFFLILDADFCPAKNFLLETLPYMYENPHVAIVQTPQYFAVESTQSAIQRGAGAIQELFYRLIQVNRDTFDAAICVGTNAVYRRQPLEPMGGTAAIGYSEDVRTGFRLQDRGHLLRYIPINLAKGTCPEDWKQFFTQQYRWAMGSLSLMLSKEFWLSKLRPIQKLCYLTGMLYYFTTGLSVIFAFMPSIYILIFKPEYLHWYNLLWSIPSLLLTNLYMRYWQKTAFTWAAVECRQVSYYAHAFALWDTIFNTAEAWVSTGSKARSKRYETFKAMLIAHTLIIVAVLCYMVLWRIGQGYNPYNFILLMLLTAYHVASVYRAGLSNE